jgi:hypothetical protein
MGKGGIIGNSNEPTQSIASGVWSLREQYNAKRSVSWPLLPTSAVELVNAGLTTDGIYTINLPTVGLTNVYCLLDPKWDGGGWMMAMKAAATGTTFQYSANYWTTDNTLNPTETNQNAGDAKFEVMNKFASKDIMARWPDISTNGGSIPSTGTWTWMENNYNSGTRQTLISWFNTGAGSRKFIRDAKTFSGWQSGVFSSQVDVRFYGFNYQNLAGTPAAKARWGFGWNENGGGLFPSGNEASNDVTGGIGLAYTASTQLYSAGDYIACCADTTGINRQARVEIYVR